MDRMPVVHVVVFLLVLFGAIRRKMPVSLGLLGPFPLHRICPIAANFVTFAAVSYFRCAMVMGTNLP